MTETKTALCGCPAGDVLGGLHTTAGCLTEFELARAEAELPVDPDPDRLRFRIGDPGTPPEFGSPDILDLTILNLGDNDPWCRPGLWQRQRDWWVPITLNTYRAHVRVCYGGGCGNCEQCTETAAYTEQLAATYARLDEAVGKASSAVEEARKLLEEIAAGAVPAVDEELSGIEFADLRAELQTGARAVRNAGRITGPHVERQHRAGRDG